MNGPADDPAEGGPEPGGHIRIPLTAKAARLARKGRPWFFADDLQAPDGGPTGGPPTGMPHGALVAVLDPEGRSLGLGMTSTSSRLALRLAGHWRGGGLPSLERFFAVRLGDALARRARLLPPGLDPAAAGLRLVHGEADHLPGLVVDRYGPVLVVQSSHPFVEATLTTWVPWLVEHTGAEAVLARNDIAARELEGLPREVRLLHGRRPGPVTIQEGDAAVGVPVAHTVDVWQGHKTGFYLDQRPARARVRGLSGAWPGGARVLDLFAYQGGFALHALAGGAREVLAVDQDAGALDRAERDAGAQGLGGLTIRAGNAFDVLRELRSGGEQFDLVVVDPPAFAKSRKEVAGAERGYRELLRTAMRVLTPPDGDRPGGQLLACSCSHHVDLERFTAVLRQAAADLKFPVALRERLGAGPDHPVLLVHPESEYLKVLRVERLG